MALTVILKKKEYVFDAYFHPVSIGEVDHSKPGPLWLASFWLIIHFHQFLY